MGAEMAKIESPKSWGRPPRDIAKHVDGFKAEELSIFFGALHASPGLRTSLSHDLSSVTEIGICNFDPKID